MAILRGGRRIGNFDIRLGLPRDKSLVDIAKDPRLQRQPGGSGVLQRFQAQINQGEGMARPNRFLVIINPPARAKLSNAELLASEFGGGSAGTNNDLESLVTRENIQMMCNKITMPSRDVNTQPARTYGPKREMPYAYSFSGEVEATFFGDKFLRQRLFWENWQKKIFNNETHDMKYYDEYVGSIDILQLGQFDAKGDDDARVTYAVRLFEVYPQTISPIEYAYGSNNAIVEVPVTLNFRTWKNLTIDEVNKATIGDAVGNKPTIKASTDFGLFGGILSKLPPEIRRAGRDVLQTTRRNLPIGRVTGGRLFPPFG
tara:strand:+ start:597 stop:1541 length:945 start_codon:yes stop_codon:yes gene_type:complete